MRQDKDRTAKWLIRHFGEEILHLAGIRGFTSWRAVQPEVVAPRRLPDGLVEVIFADHPTPIPVLIVIETYPDSTSDRQVLEDLLLILLDRGEIPEVVSLTLRPKGNVRVTGEQQLRSRRGTVELAAKWHPVELWRLQAEDLFATNEVGLVPWIPLTQFEGDPEALLRRCRERIVQHHDARQVDGLLAVTQILASLVFRELYSQEIFGETPMVLEDFPLLKRLKDEWCNKAREELRQEMRQNVEQEVRQSQLRSTHGNTIEVLSARFGTVPAEISANLQTVENEQRAVTLLRWAALCPDLPAFRERLNEGS